MVLPSKPAVNFEPPAFAIAHVTLDGVIIACDDVYASFLGVTREAAIGRRISEFVAGGESGGPEMMINILVRTGEPMSVRRVFSRQDGSTASCTFSLCLIRDQDGKAHSVVSVGQYDTRRS